MTQRVIALDQEVDRLSSDADVESVSLLWNTFNLHLELKKRKQELSGRIYL